VLPTIKLSFIGVDIDGVLIDRARMKDDYKLVEGDSITFLCLDVTTDEGKKSLLGCLEPLPLPFDLITCFSTTMWIHLEKGDEGLQDLLLFIASHSTSLLLEPQPWKCYLTAAKRWRRLKLPYSPHFHTNTWRNDVNERTIEFLQAPPCSYTTKEIFGSTEWERMLIYLRK
jgi:hypothetical protein